MRKYTSLFLIFVAAFCHGQEIKQSKTTKLIGTSSANLMTERFRRDAMKPQKDGKISWATNFIYSFPSSPKIYREMQGYGILYIAAANPDSAGFPIRRIYLKNKTGITDLREIGEMKVKVTDPRIILAFGRFRVDYYYLIPYRVIQDSCQLFMRWSNSEQDLPLTMFPLHQKLNFVDQAQPIENGDINPELLKLYMRREFHVEL